MCTDINECEDDPEICDINGTMCTDINECANDPEICSMKSNCTNTVGSYMCSCNHVY
jgi:hypothetical protein